MNYSENKEKDNTTDHKEICVSNYTGAAIFPKVCVVHISCHSLCQICCFFRLLFCNHLCFEMFVRNGPVGRQM